MDRYRGGAWRYRQRCERFGHLGSREGIKILNRPHTVAFGDIAEAIEVFNESNCNPFGPNIPVRDHSPLLLSLDEPGIKVEFPFYVFDRDAGTPARQEGQEAHQTGSTCKLPLPMLSGLSEERDKASAGAARTAIESLGENKHYTITSNRGKSGPRHAWLLNRQRMGTGKYKTKN
jgi:hypothetical protein